MVARGFERRALCLPAALNLAFENIVLDHMLDFMHTTSDDDIEMPA
jgi:hypothetical protein